MKVGNPNTTLMGARRNSQRDDFIAAYDAYSDAIYRHCFFRVSDENRARDLMQETFTKTWVHLVHGNQIENLRAFLYRTANNLIIDYYRKKKTSSLDELLENTAGPAAEPIALAQNHFEASFAIASLSQLDEIYRQVITMRYVDELPVKEIAQILNEKENVISVRLHRGLKRARALMTDGPNNNHDTFS